MADNSEESTEQNVPEENTANIATFEFGALPSRSELRKDPKRSEDFDLEREKNEKRFRIITCAYSNIFFRAQRFGVPFKSPQSV